MQSSSARRFPFVSLTLLLISYVVFGWFLARSDVFKLGTLTWVCPSFEWVAHHLGIVLTVAQKQACGAALDWDTQRNISGVIVTLGWILVTSFLFMAPLDSFTRFLNRWFQSDTIAFLCICLLAGMAAVILYWLHVFIQFLMILAAEALARIDIQTIGMSPYQAFWLLTVACLLGLGMGWGGYWFLHHPAPISVPEATLLGIWAIG